MPTRRCLVGIFHLGKPMGHISGEARFQATLFPVMLDELVAPDTMVRVIDAWVEIYLMLFPSFSITMSAGSDFSEYVTDVHRIGR
jgi:hypothetical protein